MGREGCGGGNTVRKSWAPEAQNSNEEKRKVASKPQVLVPVGGNLTREVPTPPLGNPEKDTTHKEATPRGEPRAWYERKVDTLPR